MEIHIFTIFPAMLEEFLCHGLLSKTVEAGILNIRVWDIRQAADKPQASVDDSPYGGGAGMVLRPEPIYRSVELANPPRPIYLLSPGGKKADQPLFSELSELSGFSLICGRYEGIDARVSDGLADGEISMGDFILQGGEVPAMAILEGVGRLLEGALGNSESALEESFSTEGLLEYPQYTRPDNFQGMAVPEVLKSGNHEKIRQWRRAKALEKTQRIRPDLISARGGLTEEEKKLLEDLKSGELDKQP